MAFEGIYKSYFTLPELSVYSGLGIRFLRDAIKDPEHPLPHFRLNKKTILVSRHAFADWLEPFKADSHESINQVVNQVMIDLSVKKHRQDRPRSKE
jgi:hypothetical protein